MNIHLNWWFESLRNVSSGRDIKCWYWKSANQLVDNRDNRKGEMTSRTLWRVWIGPKSASVGDAWQLAAADAVSALFAPAISQLLPTAL